MIGHSTCQTATSLGWAGCHIVSRPFSSLRGWGLGTRLVKVWKEANCRTHIECEVNWTLHVHVHKKFFGCDTCNFCRLSIMSSLKENLSGFIMKEQSHTQTLSNSTYTCVLLPVYCAGILKVICYVSGTETWDLGLKLCVWGWNYESEAETMGLGLRLWVWDWDYESEAETMGLGLRLWVWDWNYESGVETIALEFMKS